MKYFTIAIVAFLTTHTLSAQTGGIAETLYQWNGAHAGDAFGLSVSGAGDVNGDGFGDVIVGIPEVDIGGFSGTGQALIYSGLDGSPIRQWSGSHGERFGAAVGSAGDIDGDGFDDVIIGAPEDSAGTDPRTGSVFVFSGATSLEIYRWDGEDAWNYFGNAVACAGDVNADGVPDIIVGASVADPGGFAFSGSAYVFSGADGSQLYTWDGSPDDYFGYAVAGAGDVNNDGFDDVIIGANETAPNGLTQAGSAYVYSGADGSLLHHWNGTGTGDLHGSSVSGAGDVNNDGFDDVIVGSPYTDFGGLYNLGSVFIYSGSDGSILHQFDGQHQNEFFGTAVAAGSDVNGDGIQDWVIGASGTNHVSGTGRHGAVHLYSGFDGSRLYTWIGQAENDYLGSSVAITTDLEGDFASDIIAGALSADPNGLTDAGSAFAYSVNSFLRANTNSVSATSGGTVELGMDFPQSAAFYRYKVLISASGVGPTTFGVQIPLTLDTLLRQTYVNQYPVPSHSNMHGTTNATGDAFATITLPASLPSSLIGQTYWVAAIANPFGFLPELSSIAIPITVTL
jgi:hypothetical protein